MGSTPSWLQVKLAFVILLYLYHFSLHGIYKQQMRGVFRYSSQKLRIWNELATLLLFVIVFLATVKQAMSWISALIGIVSLAIVLMLAIRLYRKVRSKNG
jgi:putative membrane protein